MLVGYKWNVQLYVLAFIFFLIWFPVERRFMKSLWQSMPCLMHFLFSSLGWLQPNLLEESSLGSNICASGVNTCEGKNLSPHSRRKLLFLLIERNRRAADSTTTIISPSLPSRRLQRLLCNLQNFPLFPAHEQHLHSQFIPKLSHLLYLSVYTAVRLFAPLC